MIEVLWHGRGGQGAFTAARLLGAASALHDDTYALAFPSFGPERRGAPMRAFTKVSEQPIGDRSAITKADFVVYLDETLFAEGWERELKPGGRVLVNSTKVFEDDRIIPIDANGISEEVLGRPIPNTVFLGALSVLIQGLTDEQVREAIRQYMPAKLHEKNLAVVEEARRVLLERGNGAAAIPSLEGACSDTNAALTREAKAVSGFSDENQQVDSGSKKSDKAENQHTEETEGKGCEEVSTRSASGGGSPLDPEVYSHNTCFDAGYLTVKNAGWRNIRPVIDAEACTGCLQCYLYCPDGTIFKTTANPNRWIPHLVGQNSPEEAGSEKDDQASRAVGGKSADEFQQNCNSDLETMNVTPASIAPVAVDYDFCKGCGICSQVCKFGAITMIPESVGE